MVLAAIAGLLAGGFIVYLWRVDARKREEIRAAREQLRQGSPSGADFRFINVGVRAARKAEAEQLRKELGRG